MPRRSNAANAGAGFGDLLREWRRRRRLSQLALALSAGVSQRHLSFIELGRARPSREMVLHLAAELGAPMRERNRFLLAAGYAPVFGERPLDDPALAGARLAVERVLTGHEPYPAIAVDRRWNLLLANDAFGRLVAGAAPPLLRTPANVLRLMLHPDGLAKRTINLGEWRARLLEYLELQTSATGDPALGQLLDELRSYPVPPMPEALSGAAGSEVFVPLQLATDEGDLSLISTVTQFSTPVDVTLSELVLECFFPADAATAERLRRIADSPREEIHCVPSTSG